MDSPKHQDQSLKCKYRTSVNLVSVSGYFIQVCLVMVYMSNINNLVELKQKSSQVRFLIW